MIAASKVKAGIILFIDGQLMRVLSSYSSDLEKRTTASINTKLRNISTGALVNKHFEKDEKLEEIHLKKREFEFLYADGHNFYFMNPESFEQVHLSKKTLGPASSFLKVNEKVPLLFFKDKPVGAHFSNTVKSKTFERPAKIRTCGP